MDQTTKVTHQVAESSVPAPKGFVRCTCGHCHPGDLEKFNTNLGYSGGSARELVHDDVKNTVNFAFDVVRM